MAFELKKKDTMMKTRNIRLMMLLWAVLAFHCGGFAQNRVVVDTLFSKVLNADRAYTVVLPKSFEADTERRYPVLYLLHGMWDGNMSWVNSGRVNEVYDLLTANGEACEMVIVTPNAGGGDPEVFQNGYFDMEGWAYETFFFTEFLPYIESKYRITGDKQHRAVAGLSMGGGGATAYGERHADMFCAVYAMSALMSIPETGAARFDNPDGKLARLTRSVIENSCIDYVAKADEARKEQLRTVQWFVDCGDDDFLLDRNIEFFQAMRAAGVPCQFRVRDGGHVWEYWRSALYTCLPFVSRAFNH